MSEAEPDTKTRILAAAEAEFLAHGYDRARMQAIADRAQINKAMLHYHFRSKEELFAQVFREKVGRLFSEVKTSLHSQGDFIQFTCNFVDRYFTHLIDNPSLPNLFLQVAAHHPELLKDVAIDFPRYFVFAFNDAVKKGTIRPHDAQQFIVSLLGMCVMPFIGRNLLIGALNFDDKAYEALLANRADELKNYVVLLLTPPPRRPEER